MPAKLKLTPEISAAICKLVRLGVPIGVAARAEGIAKSTLYDWRERGARGEPGFAEFHEQIEDALAKAEAAITMNVVSAAQSDWKAGAFWLKCRNRQLYGDEITITQQVQTGVQQLLDDVSEHMSIGARKELWHAVAKVMGVDALAEGALGGIRELTAGDDADGAESQ